MKRCFRKKNIVEFLKCSIKTFRIFLISVFYSLFFYNLKNKKNKKEKTVWVGISGGVDSAVSAILLKKQGYEVVGVFMKVYQPEVVTFCWRNEMLDAKKVCKDLNIPFVFLNLEKEYKDNIFDYMINSYKNGQTPNPDVFCNKFIKFGAFLKTAVKNGADFVAMGHYARVEKIGDKFYLKKGIDKNKDQSYFLSAISQYQISKSLFPIGELEKPEVRKIAKKNNLFNADKKDSQGLCFVGKVNMREFLQNYIPRNKGKILNTKGENIGTHDGSIFYTIGERHGFKIFPEFRTPNTPRQFVLKKDMKKNTITIGEKISENIEKFLDKTEIEISQANWISGEPDFNKKYSAMIRYRGKIIDVTLEKKTNKKILAKFSEPQHAIASGQILVIYENDICLGEGVIL